jgi:DNA-binding beta-propeller fold protein YncE
MDSISLTKFGTRMVPSLCASTILLFSAGAAFGDSGSRTYTTDADFDEGTLINVTHDLIPDQLQLIDQGEPFNFIWVAASTRGTIVKIDTETGAVLGEYRSAPLGRALNPSRTTVDANGSVWAGNRDESGGGMGSIVHIGLQENGQCVDRNGNGVIETSAALGDIRPWPNTGGADDNGGVSTAEDECIIHYVRTSGTAVRTLAVDGSNNVWVGGLGNRVHELYDQNGNAVVGTQFNLGCGGYGGLVDGNGVLWSASLNTLTLLRYDPATATGACIPLGRTSYGLGIDTNGFIWHSNFGFDTVQKIDPSGAILGSFPTGGANGDRGVAVTPSDNNVWVANSNGADVSRLDEFGGVAAVIPVGFTPTGVAVDAAGKVWVTNLNSDSAMRIDPALNAVDLTVDLGPGAGPYNYSDMTGSTLTAPPDDGTWTVVYDSGFVGAPWREVSWNADTPGDSSIVVTVASSPDDVTYSPPVAVSNGGDPAVPDARYLRITAAFTRSTNADGDGNGIFDSPILFDLTAAWNRAPDCSFAAPSVEMLWPPNHQFVPVDVLGVTDPDGDPVAITVDSIFQDEPVDTLGDGSFVPDGQGVGTATAYLRAERSGTKEVPGDGRVYHVGFTAVDTLGASCSGELTVGVPHDVKDAAIDGGPLYDSTAF